MTLKTISYGGGVQSTAMIVLAVQGRIDADVALFANVGDDSEHPATLQFVRDVMQPWAVERGFPIHELRRVMRDGSERTLLEDLQRDSRTINIPVRMASGAPGNRNCTATYKMQVIGKWLKANGASNDDPADVHIGISTDEIQRLGNKTPQPYERPVYPLIDLGLSRADCQAVIADAGLPMPGKSACWFCPFKRPQQCSGASDGGGCDGVVAANRLCGCELGDAGLAAVCAAGGGCWYVSPFAAYVRDTVVGVGCGFGYGVGGFASFGFEVDGSLCAGG